ncbi:MAG: aminotransferase class IV, partial [Rothia sp.]|nr:aminotransferase class IV [Rothia sp. (in: high G+C Gram-positive bacteria)]
MSSTVILLNEQNPQGIFVDPSVPLISVDDQGFTRGDGVFETMLSVNRRVRKLGMHLSRLESSARMLDLPDPEPEILRSAVERLMREATAGAETALGEEHIVKIIISRGPTQAVTSMQPGPYTLIMASPVPASIVKRRTEGVKAMLLPRGHEPMDNSAYPWLLAGAKTLSYAVNMAVLRYVQERGADDAIFITDERRVLEGATSSV